MDGLWAIGRVGWKPQGASVPSLCRRRKDKARRVLMKLLKERSGLTQREVAVEVGLRDGSGISRHLAEVNEQLNENRTLRRTYERIVEALNH